MNPAFVLGLMASAFIATLALANTPPNTPTVLEPENGRTAAAGDVHMETGLFSDPDPGDTHLSTDWEIWFTDALNGNLSDKVWQAYGVTGASRYHIHLADGQFVGILEGNSILWHNNTYRVRVRHRDSSGQPNNVSAWATSDFLTGPPNVVYPLEIQDVANLPIPAIRNNVSGYYPLPAGATPASISLLDEHGDPYVHIRGHASGRNAVENFAPSAHHHAVKVVVAAGSNTLALPELSIYFSSGDRSHVVVLPEINLNPTETAMFWVSLPGSTYVALPSQQEPNFSTPASGVPFPWVLEPEFELDYIATGFQLPVSIAFVPNPGPNPSDPLFYVAELYGTIKVVSNDRTVSVYATDLINFDVFGGFPGSGELGVGCIAVDPTNGDVYATLLYSPNPNDIDPQKHPAVDRFTSTDGGRTAATRTRVLDMAPELQGASHQVSNITFGPDGHIYVHVGDGFDITAGQNLDRFGGKILRIDRAGQPIAANPFFDAGNGITPRDYVFSYGFRNPFGGAWRQSDAHHYTVENGPNVDRFSLLVSGRNMGFDGTDASMMTHALYNWIPAVAPVNITFLENVTFARSGFPAAFEGRAYVTQSGYTYGIGPGTVDEKAITEWQIDSTGTLVSGPRTIAYYQGTGASSAVALAAGPDGLYFSDFYKEAGTNPIAHGSNVLRLSFATPGAPDCNGNGIDDALDFTSGWSLDCNDNDIPDECDIAAGTLPDTNANGIPDGCEVPPCPANIDDGTGTGTPDAGVDINDLLYFLNCFELGTPCSDLDDDGSDPQSPDGGSDINDLLFFLGHFESGC